MAALAEEVFEAISRHLRSRTEDLARFTGTQYSFEEWCNWEAFAVCSRRAAWTCNPKPRYAHLGVDKSRDFGDLLVEERSTGRKVVVEIGIVHDGTTNKWREKLAHDRAKLGRIQPENAVPLQIVIVTKAGGSIESTPGSWLSKISFWNQPPYLEFRAPLPPNGEMLMRGWMVVSTERSRLGGGASNPPAGSAG
jgi:hypothetical protein